MWRKQGEGGRKGGGMVGSVSALALGHGGLCEARAKTIHTQASSPV